MYRPFFTTLMTDASMGSQAVPTLIQMIEQLTAMRTLLSYGMSQQDITRQNLKTLEKDLRDILKIIDTSPTIKVSLQSADAALDALDNAKMKLNLAADGLGMKQTLKVREQLYQYYRDICKYLNIAIAHLQNTR